MGAGEREPKAEMVQVVRFKGPQSAFGMGASPPSASEYSVGTKPKLPMRAQARALKWEPYAPKVPLRSSLVRCISLIL